MQICCKFALSAILQDFPKKRNAFFFSGVIRQILVYFSVTPTAIILSLMNDITVLLNSESALEAFQLCQIELKSKFNLDLNVMNSKLVPFDDTAAGPQFPEAALQMRWGFAGSRGSRSPGVGRSFLLVAQQSVLKHSSSPFSKTYSLRSKAFYARSVSCTTHRSNSCFCISVLTPQSCTGIPQSA